jgi:hypothetical protein
VRDDGVVPDTAPVEMSIRGGARWTVEPIPDGA